MISAGCAPEVLPVGADGVPGGGGVGSGIRSLRWAGGGAPVPLRVQRVCGFFAVPFWQGRPAGRLVLTNHYRVTLYRSLHLFVHRKFNTLLLLFSDLGAWFLYEMFCLLNCGARKAFFGDFGHIQRQVHVVLFQLYPTSLPCHSCRHVENLQDIS